MQNLTVLCLMGLLVMRPSLYKEGKYAGPFRYVQLLEDVVVVQFKCYGNKFK